VKVVIDTNVFVSSVFGGLPRQVVELWFDGRLTLCLSEPIVTEYQRILREIGAVSAAEERALRGLCLGGGRLVHRRPAGHRKRKPESGRR
jgi:predicted nucleic acid-binding protein